MLWVREGLLFPCSSSITLCGKSLVKGIIFYLGALPLIPGENQLKATQKDRFEEKPQQCDLHR